MFPWRRDKDWKKRGFFDDFFTGFDDEFRQMEENMAHIFDEISRSGGKIPGGKLGPGKPYVYGFSMRVGPDGKPHIQEFGNVGSKAGDAGVSEDREPLTDIINREKEVTVIAEVPGVEKKDIKLKATNAQLSIDVDTPERKYHKKLSLPSEVKPDVSRATYKNGVLEVKLTKTEKQKKEDEGVDISIE
jgi:HSP20 family protein